MPKPAGSALARLLEASDLARVVPELAPETLHRIIRHSGLDACGEIVALATPAQLASVLDLDLWRSALPGRDERFDADRFGAWLELLTERRRRRAHRGEPGSGPGRCRALPPRCGSSIPATFEPTEATDDEPIEDRAHEGPECEVGGYLVRAHRADTWDAIVDLLVALDAEHPDRFHALMRGVRRLSNSGRRSTASTTCCWRRSSSSRTWRSTGTVGAGNRGTARRPTRGLSSRWRDSGGRRP